jgi:hypothetical protein
LRVLAAILTMGFFAMSCGVEPAQQKSCEVIPPTAQSALNIEDGTDTTDFANTVLIFSGPPGGMMGKCTGTIVGHNAVLTALHCVRSEMASIYVIQTNRLTREEAGQALRRSVSPKKMVSHAGVSPTSTANLEFFPNDFVVLIFADLTFSSAAVTIPSLADIARPSQFTPAMLVGFGKSSPADTGDVSVKRLGTGFYLANSSIAKDLVVTFNRALDPQTFQPQGPKKYSQALQGDSGGPMFIKRDNRLDIVGVLSGGGNYTDGNTSSSMYVDLYSARSLELMRRAASEGAAFTKIQDANPNDVIPSQGGQSINCIN